MNEINLAINLKEMEHVYSLVHESDISYERHNNQLSIKIDKLTSYEALILKA